MGKICSCAFLIGRLKLSADAIKPDKRLGADTGMILGGAPFIFYYVENPENGTRIVRIFKNRCGKAPHLHTPVYASVNDAQIWSSSNVFSEATQIAWQAIILSRISKHSPVIMDICRSQTPVLITGCPIFLARSLHVSYNSSYWAGLWVTLYLMFYKILIFKAKS